MGVEDEPEVNLARRIIEKYKLIPPIDIEKLVRKYADLDYTKFPFEGADGVSINLKVSGKRPRVVVNSANSFLRQRFTLAHELGHILIPWHYGTIIDRIDVAAISSASDYWQIESEAFGFAAEILVPKDWVDAKLATERNLAKVHSELSDICKVSAHAVAIRLSRALPANIVYASERSGKVEFAGRTQGTLASTLPLKGSFTSTSYDYCEEHFEKKSGERVLHWWILPSKVRLSTAKDHRTWRYILERILQDIRIPAAQRHRKTLSINGVIGAANGEARKTGDHDAASVAAACMQRFKDRPEFSEFAAHPDFKVFIAKKAEDLARGR